MPHGSISAWRVVGVAILQCLVWASCVHAQGIYLPAGGPIHRSMGGASTAAPLGAIGANYWNPAAITGIDRSETEVGLELVYGSHTVDSTVGGNSGSTDAVAGTVPVPNIGWVCRLPDTPFVMGLGLNGIAGFKTNLPADPTNPILDTSMLGRVTSEAGFMQLAPSIAFDLMEDLAVAAGPIITLAQLSAEPFVFDAPNSNGVYPSGRASRYHWGGGVQAGVYYTPTGDWRFGAAVKSPIWMERFEFFSQDAAGLPRVLHMNLDLPMIVSLGVSYDGIEDWLFAADLRYFDYSRADGFGDSATYTSTAALNGLGWDSVFAVALGVEHHVTDQFTVRAGYSFNQNPIGDDDSFFNIASPLIFQHVINAGCSYRLSDRISISASYSYFVNNSVTGPIVFPTGPIAGSSLKNEMNVHLLSVGFTIRG